MIFCYNMMASSYVMVLLSHCRALYYKKTKTTYVVQLSLFSFIRITCYGLFTFFQLSISALILVEVTCLANLLPHVPQGLLHHKQPQTLFGVQVLPEWNNKSDTEDNCSFATPSGICTRWLSII